MTRMWYQNPVLIGKRRITSANIGDWIWFKERDLAVALTRKSFDGNGVCATEVYVKQASTNRGIGFFLATTDDDFREMTDVIIHEPEQVARLMSDAIIGRRLDLVIALIEIGKRSRAGGEITRYIKTQQADIESELDALVYARWIDKGIDRYGVWYSAEELPSLYCSAVSKVVVADIEQIYRRSDLSNRLQLARYAFLHGRKDVYEILRTSTGEKIFRTIEKRHGKPTAVTQTA